MGVISTLKLGAVGTVPVLPFMPIAAQLDAWGSKVHYKIDEQGHYLNGKLPGVAPSKQKAVIAVLKSNPPADPSYSNTGSKYYKLDIAPDPEHTDRFLIQIAGVTIGYGLIDPTHEIASTDEPIGTDVSDHSAGADEADKEDDSDDDTDTESEN